MPPLRHLCLALLLVALTATAQARLLVPSIFGDGAVLQRDKPLAVWGQAAPGASVSVAFAGLSASGVAAPDGRWRVELPPLAASAQGRPLEISVGAERLVARDVRVGEVWLLGGQSNIGWSLAQSTGGAEAAASAAALPLLFSFQQHPNAGASPTPATDVREGRWLALTPATAPHQSAVGFHFARALRAHLGPDIPLALVHTAMGGTAIESWLDADALASSAAGRTGAAFFRAEHQKWLARKAAWDAALAAWTAEAESARAAGRPAPQKPAELAKEPEGVRAHQLPSALFHGKIAPLQPFALRGVLWYQGESNASDTAAAARYGELLRLLVGRWREGFGDAALPFLIVQLPGYGKTSRWADWPRLRAEQAAVAATTPGCALVVTLDLGEHDDIHPRDKRPVGERAALVARRFVYHDSSAPAEAPRLLAAERAGPELRLRFASTGALSTRDGAAPRGFVWVGENGETRPLAGARLEGSTLVAPLPSSAAFTLRHAWANWPDANLTDASGLPALPFQHALPP